MPRLLILKPKELIRRLEKLGFIKDHQTGSHIIMYRNLDGKRAVIPYHLKELPKGTLMAILQESGIKKEDLIK